MPQALATAPSNIDPHNPPDRTPRPNADQDIATDGDPHYNSAIVGFNRLNRRRVREAQHQVNLLVTARIRDSRTAVEELHPDTLTSSMERIRVVARLVNKGHVGMADMRAEFVSLAATAILCAEACDRPSENGGVRLLRSSNSTKLRVA